MSDEFIVPPPASITVDSERKPVLYLPDGRALVRQAGFHGEHAMKGHGYGKSKGSAKTPKGGGPKKG